MRGRREKGFTLVELLVAMTLLGLISLMILGGLRFGARTWERTLESSESLNAVAATHRFLRARISGATGEVAGGSRSLSFESVWLSSLGAGGLYRFDLDLGGDGELRLSWRPAIEEEEAPAEELVGDRALLDGVEWLEISYFGYEEGAPEGAWRDAWEEEGRRPRLVRIDLGFSDARRAWPPLIVALAD